MAGGSSADPRVSVLKRFVRCDMVPPMPRYRHEAVLFDYGNTLVSYFTREQWPGVLDEAIAAVADVLRGRGLGVLDGPRLAAAVQAQRGESADHAVRPLAERLAAIFDLADDRADAALVDAMIRAFVTPVFATARLEDDVHPMLRHLRADGLKLGILSNTPWGTPGELWREELVRHGLIEAVDAVVFCTDTGWRKPAPQGFHRLCRLLDVTPGRAVFVGDDPRWDLAGPRAIGMDALLIDRTGTCETADLTTLADLPARLGQL